ncbi:MAG: hypothetical protein JWQ07_537 [Ramlibacter sp.]|nr:hypothetical protein [Ramlibacter sp.]
MKPRLLFRHALRTMACLGLAAAAGLALAQPAAPPTENAVKAAFLYKFASFVEWPQGTFQRADQPLVIGVSGDDAVAAELEQLAAGRAVEGHPVTVRRLPEAGTPTGVHILYLGTRREARLRESLEAVAGPVLLVTEQSEGLRLGAVLNFVLDGGRVRFTASLASADARNLKMSARLLAVAQSVEGRTR